MKLCLHVLSYQDQAPDEPLAVELGPSGGSIGRAIDNEWMLPDAARVVSGHHAAVQFADGRFLIKDTSTNGVFVNDDAARIDGARVLEDGDVITIGDYRIAVEVDDTPAPSDEPVTEDGASPTPSFTPDFGADQIHAIAPDESLDAAHLPHADAPVLDELAAHFDGLGAVSGAEEPGTEDASNQFEQVPGFRSYMEQPQPVAPEEPAETPTTKPNEPVTPPAPAPQASAHHTFLGLSSNFGRISPTPAPRAGADADAFVPPKTAQPAPSTAAADAQSDSALLAAFLEGAGLRLDDLPQGNREALFSMLGQLFRQSIAGSMDVLQSLTEVKSQFRISTTVIRPADNNPLRWAVRPEEAMMHLLDPSDDAYLPPREAIDETFAAIKAHQIGVMAGMQAAIESLLDGLDPARLEQAFAAKGGKSLLGSTKARYWDQYEQYYRALRASLHDDFQQIYGDEFARAYERQAQAIRDQGNRRDSDF